MRWTMKPKDIYLQAVRYIMLQIKGIDVNAENIKHIANIKTRRLIKLLSSTNNISSFIR